MIIRRLAVSKPGRDTKNPGKWHIMSRKSHHKYSQKHPRV